jgi:hypothetical protein
MICCLFDFNLNRNLFSLLEAKVNGKRWSHTHRRRTKSAQTDDKRRVQWMIGEAEFDQTEVATR